MIIGITGTIGAGKGTIVDYLVKEKGFAHFSARELIVEEIKKRGLSVNRDNMVLVANDMRKKHSPSWVAEELFARAQKLGKPSVIESLRTVGEIEKLREQPNFLLLAVDADQKTRFKRIQERKDSQSDDVDFQKFKEQEAKEMESTDQNKQNLSQCIAMADFVLKNDGTIEDLQSQAKKAIASFGSKTNTEQVGNTSKRQDYISWDEYFMGVAVFSAMRSKDPSTQVGACLVNNKKRIIGVGYNGWVSGIPDESLPWDRDRELTYDKTKYAYVVHAEPNALLNSTGNVEGSTIYVTMAPCNECAKLLAQSGVKEVIYLSDPYHDDPMHKAARKILELKEIPMRRYVPPQETLTIDFATIMAKDKK